MSKWGYKTLISKKNLNKPILFVLCLLSIVLMVSAVSAEAIDNDSLSTATDDLAIQSTDSVVLNDTNNGDDGVADSSNVKNFTVLKGEINNAINNKQSTLYLNGTYYQMNNTEGYVPINGNITIDGASETDGTLISTLDANQFSRIFSIASGNSVTLINLNIINGKNNSSSGGAIYLDSNTNLTIINCTFTDNYAAAFGAAIFSYSNNKISINDSEFINNKAGNAGGAIFSLSANDNVIIENSLFENNTARAGGAIQSSGNLTIAGSTFKKNTGTGGENGLGQTFNANGGAIFALGQTVISDCEFENNTAEDGGVIYSTSNLTVDNSVFKSNNATKLGGAIVAVGNVTASDCEFENNTAVNGGVIYSTGNVTASNCEFVDNTAENGGAIHGDLNSDLTVDNSVFKSNNATKLGGAIVAVGNVTASDCEFKNNTAVNGGVIYSTSNLTVDNSVFKSNNATKLGGAIVAVGNVTASDCEFENNTAVIGGVIYSTGNVTASNCEFENNIAVNGGAIYGDLNSDLTVDNSVFNSNNATKLGGAIVAIGKINVTNSAFYSNKAANGKNIYGDNNTTSISLESNWYGSNDQTGIEGIAQPKTMIVLNLAAKDNIATLSFNVKNIASGEETPYEKNAFEIPYEIASDDFTLTPNNGTLTNSVESQFNPTKFGDYTITATVGNQTITYNGYVDPINTTVILTADNVTYGNNLTGTVEVATTDNSIFNGNVTITIKGKDYNVEIKNGKGSYNVADLLDIGEYTVQANLADSGLYQGNNTSAKFNVNKANAVLNVTMPVITVGENVTATITVATVEGLKVDGTVTLTINNTKYTVDVKDGEGSFNKNITLEVGSYEVNATFVSDNCNDVNTTAILAVTSYTIELNDTILYFRNGTGVEVLVKDGNTPVANANVTVSIIGKEYDVTTDENGIATLPINLYMGEYPVSASYVDEITGAIISANANVTVLPVIVENENLVKYYKNGSQYSVKVLDGQGNPVANTNVTFNIIGKIYTLPTDENGVATLPINLYSGNYTVTAMYNGFMVSNNITVLPIIVENENLVKYYKNGSQYSVKVLDGQGNPVANTNVTFNIIGKIYTLPTDENGVATLPINLYSGNYTVTAMYNGFMVSNNITVLPIIVENENLVKYYKNGSQYSVKVLDGQGNPVANTNVTFNIIGKIYTLPTDENGVATLPINLNPGKYTVTTMYNGFMVSNTITVLSTISINDTTLKGNIGENLTAIIYDEQGNPLPYVDVTFNIAGHIYTITTNKNGTAKLSIDDFKAGKYIATVTYNGLSESATLTVK